MNDLEKLVREQLKNAEQRPPESVWNAIDSRLSAAQGTAASSAKHTGRTIAIVSAVVAVVAAAVVFFSVRQTGNDAAQTPLAVVQQPVEEEVVAAVDAAVDEVPVSESRVVASSTAVPQTVSTMQNVATPKTSYQKLDNRQGNTVMSVQYAENDVLLDDAGNQLAESPSPSVPTVDSTRNTVTSMPSEPRDTTVHRKTDVSIVIPNLLTPNGDGYNDCWVIPNLENYGTVQVQIYTDKSKRIFTSVDYHNEFCGDGYPDGNYFYVIQFREHNISRRGVLVIKR